MFNILGILFFLFYRKAGGCHWTLWQESGRSIKGKKVNQVIFLNSQYYFPHRKLSPENIFFVIMVLCNNSEYFWIFWFFSIKLFLYSMNQSFVVVMWIHYNNSVSWARNYCSLWSNSLYHSKRLCKGKHWNHTDFLSCGAIEWGKGLCIFNILVFRW